VKFAGTPLRYQVSIPERILFPTQVGTRNDGQRWRGALGSDGEARCNCMLSCAAAWYVLTRLRILDNCGTVHPPHGFLRYNQTSERNLSPRKVCAHCAHGERCACSRCLECLHNLGVYFFLARSLSLSSILSSCTTWWVLALSVDASAHAFPRSLPLRSSSSSSK